jgi:hypothetical protein
MMNLRRILFLVFLFVASVAFSASAAPGVDVIISERSTSKLAHKGKTDSRGYFETKGLSPGAYTVEMRSSKAKEWEGSSLWIGVSGGKKLVTAEAVPGAKLGGGGLAMIVEVGRGSRITGQIVTGKKMVWLPPRLGSNFPGHWVAHDSPELISPYNVSPMSRDTVRKIQEKGRPLGL